MNKLIAKLIFSIMAIVVAATLVAMSSYAWITISATPEVDGIQISIGGSDTIKVAADMTVERNGQIYHYPGTFSESLDLSKNGAYSFLYDLAALTPVSTIDGEYWIRPDYYSEEDEDVQSGLALLGQIKDVSDFIIDSELEYANITPDEQTTSMIGNYVYLDFWIVSPGEGYDIRISTGDVSGNEGSFVIDRMEVVEDEENPGVYRLESSNTSAASSLRIGFLVNSDWADYDSNLAYASSTGYDGRYSLLKGKYQSPYEHASLYSAAQNKFTIYEPNGDLHVSQDGGYSPAYYEITKPLGVKDGVITEVDFSDDDCSTSLTVQRATKWRTSANGAGSVIEQEFATYLYGQTLTGVTAEELTESFYSNRLQNIISPYVNRGRFFKSTNNLYSAAKESGIVSEVDLGGVELSGATNDAVIATLEKNVPQRIRMFIWIEGQDTDCVNYGDISNFIVNIEFAGSNDR